MTTLSEHDQQTADFYENEFDEHLAVKSSPFNNWGYWKTNTEDAAQAGRNLVLETLKHANITSQSRVLNVGCGFGVETIEIASCTPCKSIVGIDISQKQIEFANSQLSHYKSDVAQKIVFQKMSATDLQFEDESFDCVIAIDCVIHFSTRETFFKEAKRVLKPGGHLMVADHLHARQAEDEVDKLFLARAAKMRNLPEENNQNLEAYQNLLTQLGFQVHQALSIKDHVFPGAFNYFLSPKYLSVYAEHLGEKRANIERVQAVSYQQFYEKGYLDYGIFSAQKP
ncbi:MAG: methyltransferase domain-containing protein [Limnobacter sp.]|nr:methyltransferase domain-containing protein [Limnobacter sp.]